MSDPAEMPQDNTPETEAAASGDDSAAKIVALQTELTEMKDKALRALADADNARKRAERMQIDSTKFAIAGFARDLLDVADNMRRALDSVPAEARVGNDLINTLLQGVEATERSMLATLEKHGVRKIAPTSGQFDPNHHEAMFEADVPGKRSGEIIQMIEPGYMLHERLLRPARVGVAKGDPNMPDKHSLDEQV